MMRKTSWIFLGALVGVVATLLLTQPHTLLMGSAARAAASNTYRTLNLFGDVFEREAPRCTRNRKLSRKVPVLSTRSWPAIFRAISASGSGGSLTATSTA